MGELTKVINLEGLKYSEKSRRYVLDVEYASNVIEEELTLLYNGEANVKALLDRISRQFYNYVYDKKTWPEDFDKKQYLILTDSDIVRLSRDIMISHLESVVLTRRDLLVLEHGIDLDGNKLIEDFDKNMEEYQFAVDTMRMFNQHRILRYKERLNNKDIDPSAIRVGY